MEELLEIAKRTICGRGHGTGHWIGFRLEMANNEGRNHWRYGCTFFPSKNLGCYGDGGALFTKNETLAQRIRMIVNHGQGQRYYHDEIGVNSRLDSIQPPFFV